MMTRLIPAIRTINACLVATFLFASIGSLSAVQETRPVEGLHENPPSAYYLTGATVHFDAAQSDDVSLLIEHGKITRMGDFECPAGAKLIDLSGKHVYPGFIDAYVPFTPEWSRPEGSGSWNDRVRPELDAAAVFANSDIDLADHRKSGFTVAALAPAEGIIRGTGAVVLLQSDRQSAVLNPRFGQHAELTLTRRSRGGGYPNSPMGAVALARQTFYDAQWYRQAWQVAEADANVARPETNLSLAALQPVLSGEVPLVVTSSNEIFTLRADRFAREFGIPLVVKGSGNEYRRIDAIADLGRPLIIPIDFPKAPDVGSPESAMQVSLESLMHWDIAPENPGRLEQARVPFAITGEGSKDFLEQLRTAVKRGLSPQKALESITSYPAELLGIAKQTGSIGEGKLANLAVFGGELFDDKTKLVETWVAGERFEHESTPLRDLVGSWELDSNLLAGQHLVVEGDKKLSARFVAADASAESGDESPEQESASDAGEEAKGDAGSKKAKGVKLNSLDLSGVRLTGNFDTSSWDRDGIAQLSVTFTGMDLGQGRLVLPDGSREELTLRRMPAAVEEEQETDAGDAEVNEEVAEEVVVEGAGDVAIEAEIESDDAATSDDAEAPAEDAAEEVAASYPVNYPLGAFGRTAPPAAPRSLLIQNVTVWTSGPLGKLENASVLIGDGKILGVFPAGSELPEAEETLDGTGHHLTPGIIDCHSHMATDSGVNESGQAITAEVRIGDMIDGDDINIFRQLAGGVTAVNVLHGSANPIGGQNQVIKLRWGATGEEMKFSKAPEGIKFALGENVKQSNRPSSTSRYPQTRMGVEQLIRDSFATAIEYRQRQREWTKNRTGLPPRFDLELEALAEIVEGTRWIHCHSYRQDEILALIRVLDDFGITIGSFQHILEGYKVADEMAKHGAMASAFADWWAYKYEVIDGIPHAGALMHDAGVVVSFNSDDAELARHLNHEAAKAVRYGGVPEEEAFKFVTLNPARQLRIDQWTGSIEVGKDADLALWSGSPLSNLSRCEATWVDGRKYFDRSEEANARDQVAEMRQTLIQKILRSGAEMGQAGGGRQDPARLWPRYDEFCHGHEHDHDVEELWHDHGHSEGGAQ